MTCLFHLDCCHGFGFTVALDGSRLLVGSHNPSSGQAQALLFERVETERDFEWRYSRKLLPSDVGPEASFGRRVAISGGTMVVSSGVIFGAEEAVYVFSEEVFADGFESGDTSAWSGKVP